jgi:hypothetical protein
MSYRRVVRSYRRSVALQYRKLEEHPKAHLGVMVGVVVAVLGVVGGMLISGNSGTTLKSAGNAVAVASGCPSASASASAIAAPAATTPAATTGTTAPAAAAVSPARRRHRPPVTPTSSAPATTAPATTAPATSDPTTSDPATGAPTSAPTTGTAAPTTAAPTGTATSSAPATAPPTTSTSACATPSASASATTAPVDAANVSCNIIVPANPLSGPGLATPWQLTGTGGATPAASGCEMSNAASLGAFVQATILDPRTGALSVYDPLVITAGTQPAVAPAMPALPADAIVTIDVGFNGTNLSLVGASASALAQGSCVNGTQGSIFGQVSFCNGAAFFNAAFQAERRGVLKVPSAGTSPKTGQPCLTTRSFEMVDQDPSDNVTTEYLLTASGQTAQDTAANSASLAGATPLVNGSDNALLDDFIDPTMGCTPFNAPDLANNGMPTSSQALDELLASANMPAAPALVPENDEMVLINNAMSIQKTDLYREQIGQPLVSAATNRSDSPAAFCQNMVNIQTPFLSANQALLAGDSSPVPAVGNNLLTFMANRLSMSFTNLSCQNFGMTDPVTVTLDANGAATAATFSTAQQTATNTGSTSLPGPGGRHGRRHHPLMDPSGM